MPSGRSQDAERCRYCGKVLGRAEPAHARHWPFCSDRCRMAELGMWFEGRYVISRPVDEVTDDAAPPGPPGGDRGAGGGK